MLWNMLRNRTKGKLLEIVEGISRAIYPERILGEITWQIIMEEAQIQSRLEEYKFLNQAEHF